MSLAILFHFLRAQHVSDINISIIRILRYSVELRHWSYCSRFDVCWSFGVVGLEWYPCCGLKHKCFSLQHGYHIWYSLSKIVISWRWPLLAETCSYFFTVKYRHKTYYHSCVSWLKFTSPLGIFVCSVGSHYSGQFPLMSCCKEGDEHYTLPPRSSWELRSSELLHVE